MAQMGNLTPKSKALMLVNEYQQQSMGMPQLKALFQELCPTIQERHEVANEIDNALRQARYSPTDIWKLLDAVFPERTSGGGHTAATPIPAGPVSVGSKGPQNTPVSNKPVGKRTQPVKNPFIKSFDEFPAPQKSAHTPTPIPAPQKSGTTLAGAPPTAGGIHTPAPPPFPPAGHTQRHGTTQPLADNAPDIPRLKDADKTAMFGASLKGISINAVRPKTKARILVADDDQRIRFVYKTKLEENGYMVIEADNGMEAWRLIQTGEADVAILDMKMPGYHGLDVLGRMADAGMSLPVIISTAYDQLADEFIVATYPRLKYLVKPIDPNELLAIVEEFASG